VRKVDKVGEVWPLYNKIDKEREKNKKGSRKRPIFCPLS